MTTLIRTILLLALLGLAAPVQAAESPVIRVVFNTAPNPPIVYGTGTAIDPDKPSLIVELLRMVGQRTGIQFDFQRFPWQRGLYLIEYGQADAIFASSFVPERTRFGVYPMKDGQPDRRRAIHQMAYSLFVRRGAAVGWDGRIISGLRAPVGATPGFAVVDDLKAMGIPLELDASPENNLQKLANGRIDAYAELEGLADAAIAADQPRFGDIIKLSPPLRSQFYYLMFSKSFYDKFPDVAERVWDAVAEVTASAEYKALATGKYAQ
jgi:polar amino acid transport system substrate-binding protein